MNSYNKFDREFTFKDRVLQRLDEYENTKSYFATMINESNALELKEGDLIKWKVDAKQQDNYIIVGKIKDFVVNQQLPALEVFLIFFIINYFIHAYKYCCIFKYPQTYYCGNGDIRYVRMPEEIYGSSIQTVPIRAINTLDYKVLEIDFFLWKNINFEFM